MVARLSLKHYMKARLRRKCGRTRTPWPPGLRVPKAYGDFIILDITRKSNGTAIAVSDDAIMEGVKELASVEGIFACPEGGAALAAYRQLLQAGFLKDRDRVVLFNTGSGYKYLDVFAKYWGIEGFTDELKLPCLAQHGRHHWAVLESFNLGKGSTQCTAFAPSRRCCGRNVSACRPRAYWASENTYDAVQGLSESNIWSVSALRFVLGR